MSEKIIDLDKELMEKVAALERELFEEEKCHVDDDTAVINYDRSELTQVVEIKKPTATKKELISQIMKRQERANGFVPMFEGNYKNKKLSELSEILADIDGREVVKDTTNAEATNAEATNAEATNAEATNAEATNAEVIQKLKPDIKVRVAAASVNEEAMVGIEITINDTRTGKIITVKI